MRDGSTLTFVIIVFVVSEIIKKIIILLFLLRLLRVFCWNFCSPRACAVCGLTAPLLFRAFFLKNYLNKIVIFEVFIDCTTSLFAACSSTLWITGFFNLMAHVLFSYARKMITFGIHKKYKKASCLEKVTVIFKKWDFYFNKFGFEFSS